MPKPLPLPLRRIHEATKEWTRKDRFLLAAILWCSIMAIIIAIGADWTDWTIY